MPEPRFIHLRVHSDYSMVDGLVKTGALVDFVAKLGMPALGITDFTNFFGLIKFYNAAHKQGVKPIIGADFKMSSDLMGNKLTQITILASNNQGYQNLTLLISRAYLRGYGDQGPTIERDWLLEHREGILLLSGGLQGEIGQMLLRGNQRQVQASINFYQTYFPNCYYLELIRTGRINEEAYLHSAVELSIETGIPVVATNEVCFLSQLDFEAHEIRVAIQNGFTLENQKRPRLYSSQQYLRSEQEMCMLFSDIPEALENSVEIARRCNVTIQLGTYFLPKFPTGSMTTEDFLVLKSREGLEERLHVLFPEHKVRAHSRLQYDQRLNIELKIINQMGFPGYFLIVMEFIKWSKDNGVPVGPGRGSGAGSLVAYSLKITDLDPLEFNLLFERFLNPERVSMPDFDVDFCMEKRDLVIDHVAELYGRQSVSQIITFGTMAAKAVIRDVGRVLGHPYIFVDRISKMVPTDPGMTLEKAFRFSPNLSALYESDEEVKLLIDMAKKLEGVTRSAGKHAGGVVISPTKITDFSPLYCDEYGHHPVTQFDKNDVEYTGLVKFDFLGLRTLTIIDSALVMINAYRVTKHDPPIDISAIDLNDYKSFDMLRQAETTAVFQLESYGMKDLIKRLKPDCFEDIIALVALFRPGPLQSGMVDNFINRKHGLEKISYPDVQWQHELLKPVLESTYGIILYQEQVMQIAQVLAGYSLGDADMLRRAMGKKNPDEMARQRGGFEAGAQANGIDGVLAIKIFNLVEKFAGYGFNKSHSAAYALVSYQTLWLKAHYPAEFMAAVMNADIDNTDKIVLLVNECWRLGLHVLPPDINTGFYYFHVNSQGKIVYGMGAIKGIGEGTIEEIITVRNQEGSFHELFAFCLRIKTRKINRRVLEKLILSGACDCLGLHRAALMSALPDALKAAHQSSMADSIGQSDMFGVHIERPNQVQISSLDIQPWSEQIQLEGEREVLGLYLTSHPINQYLQEIQHYISEKCLKDIKLTTDGRIVTVAGLVVAIRFIVTKRGSRMGICTLDDSSGRLDVIVFIDILDKFKKFLEKDRILIVSGQVEVDNFNGKIKMMARDIMDLNTARTKYTRGLAILLTDKQMNDDLVDNLNHLLAPYRPGKTPIHLYCEKKDARVKVSLGNNWNVSLSDDLLNDLRLWVGVEQVELEFD
ncbi:DNA polymerase III subunit alpha [Candidatus Erwinia haradaeae]|uniref:DNA polymerase III subunit alpha n=1 Tax=Candidatus Erwinia haradaeae TaxID=1922217 RepID=A0A803GCA8_9GAMM|nr:DNA polymerase III subunit alpha [Candidatus Erwinia haradaeae]VFP87662.1 DNA polymerase III subunit alpha [Candidatus Erwinia haradaeae]